MKGDARLRGVVRIEAKTTKHSSFRVTEDMLDKIENAALGAGEVPAMVIEVSGKEFLVMPGWALDVLIERGKAPS